MSANRKTDLGSIPDCLKYVQKMFERNTSNIKEAGGGMLLSIPKAHK